MDKPSLSNSQEMKYDKGENPMKFDVAAGMWVIVVQGSKILRKVLGKNAGQFNVLCLEKPFGINVPQNLEKGEGVYYDNVFKNYIKPLGWEEANEVVLEVLTFHYFCVCILLSKYVLICLKGNDRSVQNLFCLFSSSPYFVLVCKLWFVFPSVFP